MRTTSVNHFERKKVEGIEHWFWEDKIGNQCGRERKWKYKVQIGEPILRKEFPQGYKYYEISYSGQPEQV